MMLSQLDYKGIGVVAFHCDKSKLEVAENHALQYDLSQLYCSFWGDIVEIWDEINTFEAALAACAADPGCIVPPTPPENYILKLGLINGGTYVNCAGKTRTQTGVRTVLVNYSYARYVILNGFNDTSTGVVSKTDPFTIPKTIKELEQFADMYRNMGKITFENTLHFLCANKNTFGFFNTGECDYNCGCGCNNNDCGGTQAKGYGLKSSNIRKR